MTSAVDRNAQAPRRRNWKLTLCVLALPILSIGWCSLKLCGPLSSGSETSHFPLLSKETGETKQPVVRALPLDQEFILSIGSLEPPRADVISPRSGVASHWPGVEEMRRLWGTVTLSLLRYGSRKWWWSPQHRRLFLRVIDHSNGKEDDLNADAVIFALELDGKFREVFRQRRKEWIGRPEEWHFACTVLSRSLEVACYEGVDKELRIQIQSFEEGAKPRRITLRRSSDYTPVVAWMPDGSALYYVDGGSYSLLRLELPSQKTTDLGPVGDRVLPNFVLSQDGSQLAIVRPREPAEGDVIVLIDTKSGNRRRVTLPVIDDGQAHHGIHELAWSPDGKQLALQSDVEGWCASRMGIGGCVMSLYVVDTDGQNFKRLSLRNTDSLHLLWLGARNP